MKNPKNLEECFAILDKKLTKKDKQEFIGYTEEKAGAIYHHNLGRSLRNVFALWGESDLKKYFVSIGIFHPDDMSGIIIKSYHRYLSGKDINLDEQIKFYQDYWSKMKNGNFTIIHNANGVEIS